MLHAGGVGEDEAGSGGEGGKEVVDRGVFAAEGFGGEGLRGFGGRGGHGCGGWCTLSVAVDGGAVVVGAVSCYGGQRQVSCYGSQR